MKVVIHIGVHKTGTTLIQRNIAENADALRASRVYALTNEWPELMDRQLDYIRRLQNANRLPLPDNALRRANRRILIAATQADATKVLMSEENYLGIALHRQLSWGHLPLRFYPMAEQCLQLLTNGIADKDLRFVLYTRKMADVLRGQYTEGLRSMTMPYTFEEMLDRCDLESFRFTRLVERLRAIRPNAELVIRRFESIKDHGAQRFAANFFRACGLRPKGFNLLNEVVYPGIDARQAEMLRGMSIVRQADQNSSMLMHYLRVINGTPPDRNNPIVMPDRYRDQVAALDQGLAQLLPPPAEPKQEAKVA